MFVSDLDFSFYKLSACIDFVKFYSTVPLDKKNRPSSAKYNEYKWPDGAFYATVTIHDPGPIDIQCVADRLPLATLKEIEIAIDLTPKGILTPLERFHRIEQAREWILSHLYPWNGPGLQVAARASSGPGRFQKVFLVDGERRPFGGETLYLGHARKKYSDPGAPNYASLRLYKKTTDKRSKLSPKKFSCRLEVTLNSEGCGHFGLVSARSILGFDFRRLGPYFRMVKAEVKPAVARRIRKYNPKLAVVVEKKLEQMAKQAFDDIGAYGAIHYKRVIVDGRHRHAGANRKIGVRLDDLTKKFKAPPPYK